MLSWFTLTFGMKPVRDEMDEYSDLDFVVIKKTTLCFSIAVRFIALPKSITLFIVQNK